jgi:hypothetical protein
MGQIASKLPEYTARFGYATGSIIAPFAESGVLAANTKREAKEKAAEWAHLNYHLVDDRTRLQVTEDGREIYRRQMGRS